MASLNKVILMGNLTRDPEVRSTSNGGTLCRFSIAINRTTRLPDGGTKEETTFVEIACFGRMAETIGRFFAKGQPIFVEGRLHVNQWEGQNGEKQRRLSVVAENFQFVSSPRNSNSSQANDSDEESGGGRTRQGQGSLEENEGDQEDPLSEEIPF